MFETISRALSSFWLKVLCLFSPSHFFFVLLRPHFRNVNGGRQYQGWDPLFNTNHVIANLDAASEDVNGSMNLISVLTFHGTVFCHVKQRSRSQAVWKRNLTVFILPYSFLRPQSKDSNDKNDQENTAVVCTVYEIVYRRSFMISANSCCVFPTVNVLVAFSLRQWNRDLTKQKRHPNRAAEYSDEHKLATKTVMYRFIPFFFYFNDNR